MPFLTREASDPPARRWPSRLRVLLITVVVVGVALVTARTASAAYWDWQDFLYNPCCPIQYSENHVNQGTYWIYLSRQNCAAKIQLWNQYTGWEQQVVGCEYLRIQVSFNTSYYTISRAINLTAGTSCYSNVRIDSTL
jgi:hypothetical protein